MQKNKLPNLFERFTFALRLVVLLIMMVRGGEVKAALIPETTAFPDANFRAWVKANYPSCFIGTDFDNACSAVATATSVSVNNLGIVNLTGIEYFTSLTSLSCRSNSLTSLPTLPINLQLLDCQTNAIATLPTLPSILTDLRCGQNPLGTLPTLPIGLIRLWCSQGSLTTLPTLPTTLQELYVQNNSLTTLPTLPASLLQLICAGNAITALPTLPNSLLWINCANNQLTTLPTLPTNLQQLWCFQNQLTTLPTIPATVAAGQLRVQNNRLTFQHIEPIIAKFVDFGDYANQGNPLASSFANAFSPAFVLYTDAGASPNNQYQWYRNDVPIIGATGATLTVNDCFKSGNIYCRITNTVVPNLVLTQARNIPFQRSDFVGVNVLFTACPAAPTASTVLSATAISTNQIDLQWTDNATTETGFWILRSTSPTSGFIQIAIAPANVGTGIVNYSDLTVLSGTTYYYQVAAINNTVNATPTNTANASTPSIPNNPSLLTATPTTSTSVSLSWTDNSTNETGFKIQRSFTSGSGFANIGTVGANVTTFTDTGLTAGTTYYYRVVATNGAGDSAPSNEASANTPLVAKLFYSAIIGGKNTIFSINPDGTGKTQLFNDVYNRVYPVISKDGIEMLYIKYKGSSGDSAWICRANIQGLNEQQLHLIPNVGVNTTSGNIFAGLSWSNDKNKILYSIYYDGFPSLNRDGDIYELNLTTNIVTNLTNDWDYVKQHGLQYSPDNSKIIFQRLETTWFAFPWAIYVMNADGSGRVKLNFGTNPSYIFASTAYSNNGSKVIYQGYNSLSDPIKLYIANSDGTGAAQVIPSVGAATGIQNACFSPDDTKIAFMRNDSLIIAQINGTVLSRFPKGTHNTFNQITWANVVLPPSPPSLLTATPTTSTSVSLSWTDNSTNETGFKIQRSLTSGSGFANIGTVGANVTTFTDTGLTAGTTYYYRVVATNAAGDSAPSNEASATPSINVGLVAYYPFSGNANDASGNGNNGTVNGATLTTDRFCNPNSAYSFDGVNNEIIIPNSTTLQSPTTNLTLSSWVYLEGWDINQNLYASIISKSISTGWQYVLILKNPNQYVILLDAYEYPTNNTNSWGFNNWYHITVSINATECKTYLNGSLIATVTGNFLSWANPDNTSSLSIGNDPQGLNEYFKGKLDEVRIYNRALSATEVATLYDLPSAPSTLSATPFSATQVNLAWTDNANNEDGYVVERSLTSGSGFSVLAILPANAVSYSDMTATEGNTYFYRVTTTKSCYQTTYSNEATATIAFATPTVSVVVAPTPIAVDLTFADNSAVEDNVILERSLTSGSGFSVLATLTPNTTTYTDNTVNEGVTYFYRLRNFKTPSTYSVYSSEASIAVPTFNPPTSLVAAAIDITQINLTWADNTTFESGYLVERSLLPMSGFAVIASLPAGSVFYTDNTVLPATQYYYRVRAELLPIFSAYSNVESATTADITPLSQATNITLTAIFSQSLGISWTNGGGTRRIIKINRINSFTNLVNATTYPSNSAYSGTGEQVVYNGSDNTAFIGGLQPKTKYFFKVYEYNGNGVTTSYLNTAAQGNPASFLTFAPTPIVLPTDLEFTEITSTTISGRFKPIQGAEGYLIVHRVKGSSPQVPPNGLALKIGDIFFNGQVIVSVGSATNFKAEGLTPATDYTFDVYAYSGENETIAYTTKSLSGTARTYNPRPILEAIAPTQALAGQGVLTLSAFGNSFIKGANILWEGTPLSTVFVSETELKAEVNSSYFFTARKYNVSVSNPPLGGGTSKELPFEVKPSYHVMPVKVSDKLVLPETQNHLIHRVCIYAFGEDNALKQIKFDLSGTFKPQDLEKNAFTLWLSQDTLLDNKDIKLRDFPAAKSLVFETVANTPLPIKINEPFCLLLSANIAEKATAGHTIQVSPITEKDIQLSREVTLLTGTIPYVNTGLHTIKRIYLDNIPDSMRLVRWCRAMKGEEWIKKWDFKEPVGKWHGIELDQLGKVRRISLVNNNLQGNLSDEIFTDESDAITTPMQYLNLTNNKITGKLPEGIGKCKNMEYLDLSQNQMQGETGRGLSQMTNLITLWLSYNYFEALSDDIGQCKKLRNLHCNHNKISTLPSSISQLLLLESLRFENNELKILPEGLASLPNLKFCYLQNNALDFEYIEPLVDRQNKLTTFIYAPQAKIGMPQEIYVEEGSVFELSVTTKGKYNQYTWYKDEKPHQTTITSKYQAILNYSKIGGYKLVVTNEKCKDLVLESHILQVKMYCNDNKTLLSVTTKNNPIICSEDKASVGLTLNIPAQFNQEVMAIQWFLESKPILGAVQQNFTAKEAGNYYAKISIANTCTFVSETININKTPKPSIFLQKEGNFLKVISNIKVTNYEWFLNEKYLEAYTGATLNIVESGSYSVRITDNNGCQAMSEAINITITGDKENMMYPNQLEIYPNPTADWTYIKAKEAIIKHILVYNALGNKAFEADFSIPIQTYTFSLANKALGIYWVEIHTTKAKTIQKLIKQ